MKGLLHNTAHNCSIQTAKTISLARLTGTKVVYDFQSESN